MYQYQWKQLKFWKLWFLDQFDHQKHEKQHDQPIDNIDFNEKIRFILYWIPLKIDFVDQKGLEHGNQFISRVKGQQDQKEILIDIDVGQS